MQKSILEGLASLLQAAIVAPKLRDFAAGEEATSMHMHLTKDAPKSFEDVAKDQTYHVKFKPASEAELKALGDVPDGFIAGWASTKDLDSYRHRIVPGAFQEAMDKRGLLGPTGIKLLIGHNWDKVAGVIKKLEYRNGDLWIEAQLNLNISYAKDAYEAAKMAEGLSFSVGFMLEKYAIEKDSDDREWLRIDKGDLYEVSVVPFPGNEAAGMVYVKGREEPIKTIAEFEKLMIASGLAKSRNDAKRLTQEVKALFAAAKAAGSQADPPPISAPPVLAVEKVQKLAELAAQMKATLAS